MIRHTADILSECLTNLCPALTFQQHVTDLMVSNREEDDLVGSAYRFSPDYKKNDVTEGNLRVCDFWISVCGMGRFAPSVCVGGLLLARVTLP